MENNYYTILSSTAFGLPDLDLRPSRPARSSLFAWIDCCPVCGYCAGDITKAPDNAKYIVTSEIYKKQLADPSFSKLTNSFLCKAIIDESAGNYSAAAWAAIHAAWVCDDEEKVEGAKMCRNKAVDMVLHAIKNGQKLADQHGAEFGILVDLLRRASRFFEARQLIEEKRSEVKDKVILKVLDFQEKLIAVGDDKCHTVEEALEAARIE